MKFPDQRTKSWFLSNSPGPLLTILVTYLYFCLYAGPRYMKNRKPFQLKNTLIVYNIIQVVFSIVLVIEVSFPVQKMSTERKTAFLTVLKFIANWRRLITIWNLIDFKSPQNYYSCELFLKSCLHISLPSPFISYQ